MDTNIMNAPESRVLAMASCLKDARDAYKHAEIEPTPEDIRTVAISFFIDMNKNSRMDRMDAKPSTPFNQGRVAPTVQPIAPSMSASGVCNKCGAPMKMSSKGKAYCSKLCWKNG